MFKLDLEKGEEPEVKLPISAGSSKTQKSSKKHLLLLYWLHQSLDCVDLNKLWKILKETGITDHFTCLLRKPYAGQEATVRTGHGKMDCSNLEKEYVKAVYCHPDFNLGFPAGSDGKESTCNAGDMGSSPRLERSLYMHSTSCEMLGWMKLKLKSRLLGEISITSYMQKTPS